MYDFCVYDSFGQDGAFIFFLVKQDGAFKFNITLQKGVMDPILKINKKCPKISLPLPFVSS